MLVTHHSSVFSPVEWPFYGHFEVYWYPIFRQTYMDLVESGQFQGQFSSRLVLRGSDPLVCARFVRHAFFGAPPEALPREVGGCRVRGWGPWGWGPDKSVKQPQHFMVYPCLSCSLEKWLQTSKNWVYHTGLNIENVRLGCA